MHSMWRRSEDVTGGGNAKEFQMRCEVCVREEVEALSCFVNQVTRVTCMHRFS